VSHRTIGQPRLLALSALQADATLFGVTQRDDQPQGGQLCTLPVAFEDDSALARALLQEHPAAPRVLWDRFSVLVRRLLQRTLGSSDVDDVAQVAFMRIYSRVSSLREPAKLRSFVVGVTMRVAREELRRARLRRWLMVGGHCAERPVQGADFSAAEALARLDALLERLDPDTRIVFVLRFVEDVPTADIAAALGCSLATAKRRVLRARTKVERSAQNDPVLAAFVTEGLAAEETRRADG